MRTACHAGGCALHAHPGNPETQRESRAGNPAFQRVESPASKPCVSTRGGSCLTKPRVSTRLYVPRNRAPGWASRLILVPGQTSLTCRPIAGDEHLATEDRLRALIALLKMTSHVDRLLAIQTVLTLIPPDVAAQGLTEAWQPTNAERRLIRIFRRPAISPSPLAPTSATPQSQRASTPIFLDNRHFCSIMRTPVLVHRSCRIRPHGVTRRRPLPTAVLPGVAPAAPAARPGNPPFRRRRPCPWCA
jgi:hypothetical protein